MNTMTKQKASLVEFLRSIKFSQKSPSSDHGECATHFAHFNPRVGSGRKKSNEDSQLIRSAN